MFLSIDLIWNRCQIFLVGKPRARLSTVENSVPKSISPDAGSFVSH